MRMPKTWQRLIALVGMVAVALLAGWLFIIASLAARGVFENQDPEDFARGERLSVIAAIAAGGALTSLVGLALRRRIPTAVGAVVVGVCVGVVFADWSANGWRLGNEDSDFVAVLVGSLGVSALALWASLARRRSRPDRR